MGDCRGTTVRRLSLTEDMTIYRAEQHKGLLTGALQACDTLELDLSGVSEIDTAGVQLLILVKCEAERHGKQARIVSRGAAVSEVVDFLNMAAAFDDPVPLAATR